MSIPAHRLDCLPLTPSDGARVSDADLRRIEPLQRALLSPLDHATVDEWRAAVNRTLVDVFDSDAAMFQLDLQGVELPFSREFESWVLKQYTDELIPEFARDHPLYDRAVRFGAGNRSILWGPSLEWLYQSEYFNDLVAQHRAFDPLWASAPAGPKAYPAILHTYHDHRRSNHLFDAADVSLMRLVQPALHAGVQTVARAAASRAALTASLDGRRDGALVYDLEGRLLHRNGAVGALAVTTRDERALTDTGRAMALGFGSGAIQDVLKPPNVSRSVTTRSGEYDLFAVRVCEGGFALRPAVLVTVVAGPPPLPQRAELRDRFGLTPRQAEVALLLARRLTDPEIAERLCISPHTARRHTEAVMGKLQVHDRREIETTLRGSAAD